MKLLYLVSLLFLVSLSLVAQGRNVPGNTKSGEADSSLGSLEKDSSLDDRHVGWRDCLTDTDTLFSPPAPRYLILHIFQFFFFLFFCSFSSSFYLLPSAEHCSPCICLYWCSSFYKCLFSVFLLLPLFLLMHFLLLLLLLLLLLPLLFLFLFLIFFPTSIFVVVVSIMLFSCCSFFFQEPLGGQRNRAP